MPAIKKTKKTAKTVKVSDKKCSLVIVESPTKERTISKFLGPKFIVRSTFGHVRDLPAKRFGVDVDNGFEPQYEILPRGKKVFADFKKVIQQCSKVYLATDYDREGEAIAWHVVQLLDLPKEDVFRITFHEITPEAIQAAIDSPRQVDQSLVDAQVARRVLDRIVGYRLSPLLWTKVRKGLSAGRVQSVAVKIICDREEEIEKFNKDEYWTLQVELENTKDARKFVFPAHLIEWKGQKLQKLDVKDEKTALEIDGGLKSSAYKVLSVLFKEKRRNAPPPFMTSTMAQDASRRFGFSAKRTMSIAQSLYEGVQIDKTSVGLITYMRTDSLNIAESAQKEAREYIAKKFGASAMPEKPKIYKTKAKGAQEAHEAIRPTSVLRDPESMEQYLNIDQAKLYGLIWKRFVASQMSEAVYDTVTAEIEAGEGTSVNGILRAHGSALKDPGFLTVYGEEADTDEPSQDDDKKTSSIPLLSQDEPLKFIKTVPEQHFTEPPPRYNEASLIKALETNGIGRPSTYAPIVDTIITRGYVRLQEKRFYPTQLGRTVNDLLKQFFSAIVDTNFTAKIEEKLDQIADSEIQWDAVVGEFYRPFIEDLKTAEVSMPTVKVGPKDSGEICPLCGGKMLIRESRFGQYMSCEKFPACKHKVSLDSNGQKVVPQITDDKCHKCGSPMAVKMGRRGKFLACTGYPNCKNIIGLDKDGNKIIRPEPQMTDKKCEKCGKPMLLRVGKRGPFIACSGFPKCRNTKRVA